MTAAIVQKEAGTTVHVWAGGNGFVTGSLGFSIAYETLAARSAVTAKLGASKAWWAANRQFREHVVSMEPDTIYRYIRGGTMGPNIPLGTTVQRMIHVAAKLPGPQPMRAPVGAPPEDMANSPAESAVEDIPEEPQA